MTTINPADLIGATVVVSPSDDRHGGRVGVVTALPVADYAKVTFADGGDTATLSVRLLKSVKH
jgi:hypothetical protein